MGSTIYIAAVDSLGLDLGKKKKKKTPKINFDEEEVSMRGLLEARWSYGHAPHSAGGRRGR